MNIPVLVLLGFAAWTLIILSVGVGGYRWTLILSGHASVAGWRAELATGRRLVSARHACAHELHREPAGLWSDCRGPDGRRFAEPSHRRTL